MTSPAPVVVPQPPRTFPPAGPARPGAPAGVPGRSKVSAFLSTPKGQLSAAGGAVVLYALYRRYKTSQAAGAGGVGTDTSSGTASTSTGAGIPTADTTGTDLYSSLEPIIEQLSGFDGAQSLAAGQAAQTAALLAAINAGKGTTTTGGTGTAGGGTTTPGTPAKAPPFPNQVHQVGQVGKSYKLADLIKSYYPKASSQQDAEILYATVANDRSLGSGVVPGGKKVTFWSQAVK